MKRVPGLAALAIGVAACGSAPTQPEQESAGDASTGSESEQETDGGEDESSESDDPQEECSADDDCPAGSQCDAGRCVATGGEGGDGSSGGEECQDGACEDACASDLDCELGALRVADGGPSACLRQPVVQGCLDTHLVRVMDIDAEDVASLSFVDADDDGSAELAIGRHSGLELLRPGETKPVTLLQTTGGAVLDVVDGDFTGDGIGDLLVADATGLTVLARSGSGEYAPAVRLTLPVAPVKLEPLGWDGPGGREVAMLLDNGRVELRFGANLLGPMLPLNAAHGRDLAVADVDGDGFDDVAVQSGDSTPVFRGNALADIDSDLTIGVDGFVADGVVAGHFADPSPVAIARHREVVGQWTLVEGGYESARFRGQALLATGSVSEAGDVDGDGYDDLVLVDSWEVSVAFGGASDGGMFSCLAWHGLDTPASMLAVGDRDGDGRAELVVSHGVGIAVLLVP